MIDFKVESPLEALDLARDLALDSERHEPFKVVRIGGSFHVRKLNTKGTPLAIYRPIPRRGKHGSRTDLQTD